MRLSALPAIESEILSHDPDGNSGAGSQIFAPKHRLPELAEISRSRNKRDEQG
jgi:hypothetical protein